MPALGVNVIAEVLFLLEYVHWRRRDDAGERFVDRSLNLTAHGFF